MSGIFGVVSKSNCAETLLYGTDYHSHLGTEYGGVAVLGEDFTCFIGADNKKIGRAAGEWISKTLGGKGRVVELKGLMTSTPGQARNSGFREGIAGSAIEVVFEADKEGTITFASQIAYDVFGYDQEDFKRGLSVFQMLAPNDRDRARENVKRVMEGETLGSVEYTAQNKDGITFPVIVNTAPIMHGDEAVGIRGVLVDISERKRAEETIRQLAYYDPLTSLPNST